MRQVLSQLLNLPNSIFRLLDRDFLSARLLKACLLSMLFSLSFFAVSAPLKGASQTPWVSIPTALEKEDNAIVFGCSIPSESKYYKLLESFYRKIFAQLGYEFSMISLPRGREVAELLKNTIDGTCGRRKDAPHHVFSTLKRLPTPIITLSYVLLSRDPYPDIRYLNEIPAGKTLAYVRGGAVAQDILDKQTHIKVFKVTDSEVGIKMLAGGRVDFFFGISVTANDVLSVLEFEQTIYTNTLAAQQEIYTFLVPPRESLVEPMAHQMKKELELLHKAYLFEL